MKTLQWNQVNAWRLRQQALANRLAGQDFLQAAERTVGVQSQVMSAAELAFYARVDGLTAARVQAALWQEHTLVKSWAMRGTLHLLTASDLPLYTAARRAHPAVDWVKYFEYYGIPAALFEDYLAAAPRVLGSEPLTREQLAQALADETGSPEIRALVLSKSWGSPLKPLAWQGDLCFGPNRGRNVTFVHPARWIGNWPSYEPYPALQEIARRYLRAYGPSTPENFAHWWDGSAGVVPARKLFRSLADELEVVEVEGWRAFALRAMLEPMQNLELQGTVHLLPLFDAYVLGLGRGADLEPLLPPLHRSRVYRPQGWISAVVLVDGYIQGVWDEKTSASQTTLTFRLFSDPTARVRAGIAAEAERMSAFLQKKIGLEFEIL